MIIPEDSKLGEEFIKIARGLHFVHTGEIVPTSYDMEVFLNDQIIYLEGLSQAPYFRSDTDFFEYFGSSTKEDRKAGIWYMRFYQATTAMVYFRPKSKLQFPQYPLNSDTKFSLGHYRDFLCSQLAFLAALQIEKIGLTILS